MQESPPQSPEKLYDAIISTGRARPAQRVSILASDIQIAMEKLEAQYGKNNVFNLHNKEDAAKPRGIREGGGAIRVRSNNRCGGVMRQWVGASGAGRLCALGATRRGCRPLSFTVREGRPLTYCPLYIHFAYAFHVG